MGTRKLDLRSAPHNFDQAVNSVYKAAFGPSPALYRQISLCGWRPLLDLNSCDASSEKDHKKSVLLPYPSSPGIEIYETAEGITVEVALSNINEESLHLAIAGKMLIIRGERIVDGRHKRTAVRSEDIHPRFQHFIQIPTTVNAGCFRAQLKGDVVQIEFAKRH